MAADAENSKQRPKGGRDSRQKSGSGFEKRQRQSEYKVKEMGFKVEEEWEMDDNTIELTVTRWV